MSATPNLARWSTLKSILRSPAHYRHAAFTDRGDTDTLRIGRATHCAVLEPKLFDERWATWTGGRRAGKEWEAFKADLAGREQLSESEREDVLAIANAVQANEHAARLLSAGVAERERVWRDEETGVSCGGRPDWVRGDGAGLVLDLKTCRDASPRAFGRAAHELQYHTQLVWYADGCGMPDAELVIVAVETTAPFVVCVYTLDEVTRDLGRATYREALRTLRACRASDRWPGYAVEPTPLQLPAYAFPVSDELEMAMEGMSDG